MHKPYQRSSCSKSNCEVVQNLEDVIEADTAAILGDLDLLTKVNVAARERYKSMTEATSGLEDDSEYLREKCKQHALPCNRSY